MKIKIGNRDLIWSYMGYALNLCVNVLLIPFAVKYISASELGLWYTFLSIGSLVQLLDFGFSTTLVRNVTYAWSGVTTLKKEGFQKLDTSAGEDGTHTDFRLLVLILKSSATICLIVALVALLVMVSAGSVYVSYIVRDLNVELMLIAWFIYALAVFLNIYYNYWTTSLKGVGAIAQSQKAIVFSKLVQIVISIAGMVMGYGIFAMTVAYLLSGVTLRVFSKWYLYHYKEIGAYIKKYSPTLKRAEKTELLKLVWFNAKKTGIASVASFLITQSTTLICSAYLSLEVTSVYGLTLQIVNAIVSVAQMYFQTIVPMLTDLKVSNDKDKEIKLLSKAVTVYWLLYWCGVLGMSVIGMPLLRLLKPNTVIPLGMFLFVGLYMFLERNHSLFCNYISLSNTIPYVQAGVYSGLITVVTLFVAASVFHADIYALMFIQFFIQLSYNNWKWPYVVLKSIKINLFTMFKIGVKEIQWDIRNKCKRKTVAR